MTTPLKGVYEKVVGTGIWWIRWTDAKGKLHREKAGRRGDAITLLSKRRTETLQRKKLPENFRAKAITFRTLCADAIEHSESANSPKSTIDLKLKINELLPIFGDTNAEDITKQEIVRWLKTKSTERVWKPSTRNRWQAAFSLIFRVGIDNEKITTNPASRIRRKTENNGRVRFLATGEEFILRGAITDPKQIAALEISLYTGMRQSEQYSLLWGQIDLENRSLYLPKTKNGKPRHIPLHPVAVSAFEVLKGSGEVAKTSPVFPGRAGEAAQGARGWFKDAVTRAEIPDYTWHCNRHTFASRLVMLGVDLRTVGELLGHRSLQMTLRYSHLAPSHTASAVDRLLAPELAPAV
ncbi:MAG TPA: site-specific integrase [Acidobacteriaceae bacterium]|jgi:integrase|nr:site-specific integrase [Acidobacteriaceae bacterium]